MTMVPETLGWLQRMAIFKTSLPSFKNPRAPGMDHHARILCADGRICAASQWNTNPSNIFFKVLDRSRYPQVELHKEV